MDLVQTFLDEFCEIGEKNFIEKHNHPILLYPDNDETGRLSTYHTRMAIRDPQQKLDARSTEIARFRILLPNTPPGQAFPAKMLLGRTQDRDFTINHPTISKRHAYFLLDEKKGSYKLGDAGSTNGTSINGRSVEAGDPVFVRDGSVITFGECDYLFFSPAGFAKLLQQLRY